MGIKDRQGGCALLRARTDDGGAKARAGTQGFDKSLAQRLQIALVGVEWAEGLARVNFQTNSVSTRRQDWPLPNRGRPAHNVHEGFQRRRRLSLAFGRCEFYFWLVPLIIEDIDGVSKEQPH